MKRPRIKINSAKKCEHSITYIIYNGYIILYTENRIKQNKKKLHTTT